MLNVAATEALGQQHLDRLPPQLIDVVAKHCCGGWVDKYDPALGVGHEDGVRQAVKQEPEVQIGWMWSLSPAQS